jgi:hypothetical protein
MVGEVVLPAFIVSYQISKDTENNKGVAAGRKGSYCFLDLFIFLILAFPC